MCEYMSMHVYTHWWRLEGNLLAEVGSLLLPCESQGFNEIKVEMEDLGSL